MFVVYLYRDHRKDVTIEMDRAFLNREDALTHARRLTAKRDDDDDNDDDDVEIEPEYVSAEDAIYDECIHSRAYFRCAVVRTPLVARCGATTGPSSD